MTIVNGNEGCGSKCKSLSLEEAFFKFSLWTCNVQSLTIVHGLPNLFIWVCVLVLISVVIWIEEQNFIQKQKKDINMQFISSQDNWFFKMIVKNC
jgi:hypothetical protein